MPSHTHIFWAVLIGIMTILTANWLQKKIDQTT